MNVDIKGFRKRFNRMGARVGMSIALALVDVLPYRAFCRMMEIFLLLWFSGAKHLRKTAKESLSTAFAGEKSPQEIDRLIRQCFVNIGYSMRDLVFFSLHPTQVQERFTVENRHYLDEAVQKDNGVILVTAHFGNFPLMLLELAQLGYKPSVILRKARDTQMADKIYEIMSKVGVETIYSLPARESVRKSLQVLRDKDILCILMDQNFGSGSGVFVEFFGRKAATATGPVVLAHRTGAVLLPVFTIRGEDGRYRVIFEPPIELEKTENYEAMLLKTVERITKLFETYIRKYPAEWGWMHRRWKSQEQG